MISAAVVESFKKFIPSENIHLQESMSNHTTFRVGGAADCLIEIQNEEQLRRAQDYLSRMELPFVLLGNGSNVLVSDAGFPGVVLQLGRGMSEIRIEGNCVIAQAGAQLAQVSAAAREAGLAGLEFACGIPGTVGGGVVMNAGAYGGEMKQVVSSVTVMSPQGEVLELGNADMEFGYRRSVIRNRPFAVTKVVFALEPGDREQIKARMDELAAKRREKQPLEYPSAGSTFKRPEGYFAGELIMKAGLRGFRIGGAQVSEKHCGFVINAAGASAADIMEVIQEVKMRVKNQFNVELEPEIVMLGF